MSGFSYPPPPPPPPPSTSSSTGTAPNHQNSGRGRGTYPDKSVGHTRGRGRGRGFSQGFDGRHQPTSDHTAQQWRGQQPHLDRYSNSNDNSPASDRSSNWSRDSNNAAGIASHKRKLEAFGSSHYENQRRQRAPDPPAAPSVPRFDVISALTSANTVSKDKKTSLTQSKPLDIDRAKASAQPSTRQKHLGLLPRDESTAGPISDDDNILEDSGDDEAAVDEDDDEEATLLAKLDPNLAFEHNGAFLSVSTPEEIAAWRAERRKHFPTQQNIAAKDREKVLVGEERRRLLLDALRVLQGNSANEIPSAYRASHGVRNSNTDTNTAITTGTDAVNKQPTDMLPGNAPGDESDDAGPEELSSSVASKTQHNNHEAQRICHFFAKSGRCKFGNHCQFVHDRTTYRNTSGANSDSRSKRLRTVEPDKNNIHALLMERDKLEENKFVLEVIMALGDDGFFDD